MASRPEDSGAEGEARQAARGAIRCWRDPAALAVNARERRGYMNTDVGLGITYPGDLDEYDLATGGAIPDGYVEVTAGYREGDFVVHLLAEGEYLNILAQELRARGMDEAAATLQRRGPPMGGTRSEAERE
jgi:hypothetical protein